MTVNTFCEDDENTAVCAVNPLEIIVFPLTSNFCLGVVVPIPTFPLVVFSNTSPLTICIAICLPFAIDVIVGLCK